MVPVKTKQGPLGCWVCGTWVVSKRCLDWLLRRWKHFSPVLAEVESLRVCVIISGVAFGQEFVQVYVRELSLSFFLYVCCFVHDTSDTPLIIVFHDNIWVAVWGRGVLQHKQCCIFGNLRVDMEVEAIYSWVQAGTMTLRWRPSVLSPVLCSGQVCGGSIFVSLWHGNSPIVIGDQKKP